MRGMKTVGLLFALWTVGCGGNGTVPAASDPRCAAFCTIEMPDNPLAFDVCSTDSAASCVQICEQHIAGTSSVCADCLLEDGGFGGDSAEGSPTSCTSGSGSCTGSASQCTASNASTTCTYCNDDQAAQDACEAKLFPRRVIACMPDFRPVSACADLCVPSK